jgi:hypothetical protein
LKAKDKELYYKYLEWKMEWKWWLNPKSFQKHLGHHIHP